MNVSQVYRRPPPDAAVLAEYEALPVGTSPQVFMDAAVVARDDDDIEVLSRAFTGDREGYANTHRQPTAATMARVAHDFAEAEDDIGEFDALMPLFYRNIFTFCTGLTLQILDLWLGSNRQRLFTPPVDFWQQIF